MPIGSLGNKRLTTLMPADSAKPPWAAWRVGQDDAETFTPKVMTAAAMAEREGMVQPAERHGRRNGVTEAGM